MKAAGGVDDHHVAQAVDGLLHPFPGNVHRVGAVVAVHLHPDFAAQGLQLVGGGGAVHVGRHQKRAVVLLLQPIGQLGGGGGFAGTLQAHQHDDGGDAVAQLQLGVAAAQKLGQLIEHYLDDVLGRREGIQHVRFQAALLGAGHKGLHHFEVHVRLQKRHADLAHSGIDVLFGEAPLRAQSRENALQAIRKVLKHCCLLLLGLLGEIPHQGTGEIGRVEIPQVVDALSHANLDDGKVQLVANRKGDAALGGAVPAWSG